MTARELGILFKPEMVRAILVNAKTQTRRIVKTKRGEDLFVVASRRFGGPGDRLWVKETFSFGWSFREIKPRDVPSFAAVHYWSDGDPLGGDWTRPKTSMFMPRWASRIDLLRLNPLRFERACDISEFDARAEGAKNRDDFAELWQRINGVNLDKDKRVIAVVDFRRIRP